MLREQHYLVIETKHEIDYPINTFDLEIRNPYSEIKVKLTHNNDNQ